MSLSGVWKQKVNRNPCDSKLRSCQWHRLKLSWYTAALYAGHIIETPSVHQPSIPLPISVLDSLYLMSGKTNTTFIPFVCKLFHLCYISDQSRAPPNLLSQTAKGIWLKSECTVNWTGAITLIIYIGRVGGDSTCWGYLLECSGPLLVASSSCKCVFCSNLKINWIWSSRRPALSLDAPWATAGGARQENTNQITSLFENISHTLCKH